MAKLIPLQALATTYYTAGAGAPPSLAIDVNNSTAWQTNSVGPTIPDVLVLQFGVPVTPKQFRFLFQTWSKDLRIGYSLTGGVAKANYTEIKAVDMTAEPNDSLGKPWANNALGSSTSKTNVVLLPDNTIAARFWAIWMNDTTGVDRARVMEFSAFDSVADDVVNPKIPATVPTAPWAATPVDWTRTEFNTPGTVNFTPAPDTKMVMVIAQAAGAGGAIKNFRNGDVNSALATPGGDTIISRANGDQLIVASGGRAPAVGDLTFPTIANWVQAPAALTAGNGSTINQNKYSGVGGASELGVRGASYYYEQEPDKDLTVDFRTASDPKWVPQLQSGWARNSQYGWYSTNKSANSTGNVIFQAVQYYAGQQVTFTWASSSEASDKLSIYALPPAGGSTAIVGGIGGVNNSGTAMYTIPADGMYRFQFSYSKDGTISSGLDQVWVTMVNTFSGYNADSIGGAAGRSASLLALAEPLTLTIGAGGVGAPADHAVTSAQNGTKGSGGAGGGNGGDGAVIIYEYKGFLTGEEPLPPEVVANYNVSDTAVVPGVYRTNYVGTRYVDATPNEFTTYQHRLRPRTKTVYALLIGAGGINTGAASGTPAYQTAPTTLKCGALEFIAESGFRQSYSTAGTGGSFSPTDAFVWARNGYTGYSYNNQGQNRPTSPLVSIYGQGGTQAFGSYAGGGGAAWGLVLLKDIPENRTLDLQVANVGTGTNSTATQGAIFIFETEAESGPYITQNSLQTLLKNSQSATQITQVSEQTLIKSPTFTGSQITQVSEQAFVKEKQVATQITQVSEQILITESDNVNNPLQVSYAAMAYIIDAPDPQTAITQVSEQVLVKAPNNNTNITQSAQQILLKAFPATFRFTQVSQQLLIAETPSVFWLNFGNLEYPVKNALYDSRTARCTSVPQDAYIQLEGDFAEGSYMLVNGVNVGLSSPVKENDQVQLHAGVTNYWQLSINVYTYYMTNGEVTREMVGRWNIIQPELSPQKPRAYSVYYTNKQWLLTKTKYSKASITSVFTKARIALSNTMQILFAKANTTIGTKLDVLFGRVTTAMLEPIAPVYNGVRFGTHANQSMFTKALSTIAAGARSMITKAYYGDFKLDKFQHVQAQDSYAKNTYNTGVGTGAAYYTMDPEQIQAAYGLATQEEFHRLAQGSALLENAEFIESGVGTESVDIAFDPLPLGSTAPVDQDFDYVQVGKSYSETQEYEAMLTTGFASTFEMGFTDTIAYSVLNSFDFVGVRSGGTGFWIVPLDTADITRPKMSLMQLFPAEKSNNHSEFVQNNPEAHGAHEFHNFSTYPIFAGAPGNALYRTGIIKRIERVVPVQIGWVRVKAQMGVYKNTPYRPAQIATGRGNASLYQGFDTLNDVLDFTANYSGVTTLQKFNGYVYNLDVDKTFVCEVYYNGPISGLMQGG
jgi:hypothetical protein|uniref:Uncharacterized protein n=1 Tax=Myoviridae sp. ctshb19 TaxID=2825194 RepID=A0A8S5UH44_9CAUD|nr:MAG TPA: hypothetical protein [Myoviridae sp. ctshb19]